MSKSSKTLKACEIPILITAQVKAAQVTRREWIWWMRDTYTYAMAMKMARFMGLSCMTLPFYQRMREAGILLSQSQKAQDTTVVISHDTRL